MLSYRQTSKDGDRLDHAVSTVLAQGRTAYQAYEIFHTPSHGVCVALDGDIQSCESDEALYHEALVHPAMLLHPAPRRVLIMGGGEGATAREVLRYSSVEQVIMVDIDAEFVALCREHLASWNALAYADSRLSVQYRDIHAFLEEGDSDFDVVIGDLVDCHDADEPAASLYSQPFYAQLHQRLNNGAILSTQAGGVSTSYVEGAHRVCTTLAKAFPMVGAYAVAVPSFYHLWCFALAANSGLPGPENPPFETFITRAAARRVELEGCGPEGLAAAFALPRAIRERVIPSALHQSVAE